MEEKRIKRYKDKLEFLNQTTKNLEEWTKDLNEKDFIEDSELQKKYGIYHAFQLIIEIITDISAMIVKDIKVIPKDDYTNIEILNKKNIIISNLATELKEANGLRNRIAHDYNGLDDGIAYNRLVEFVKSIKKFFLYSNFKNWLIKSL